MTTANTTLERNYEEVCNLDSFFGEMGEHLETLTGAKDLLADVKADLEGANDLMALAAAGERSQKRLHAIFQLMFMTLRQLDHAQEQAVLSKDILFKSLASEREQGNA